MLCAYGAIVRPRRLLVARVSDASRPGRGFDLHVLLRPTPPVSTPRPAQAKSDPIRPDQSQRAERNITTLSDVWLAEARTPNGTPSCAKEVGRFADTRGVLRRVLGR